MMPSKKQGERTTTTRGWLTGTKPASPHLATKTPVVLARGSQHHRRYAWTCELFDDDELAGATGEGE